MELATPDLDAANQLIELSLKIDNPKLNTRLRDDLENRQAQVQKRDSQHNQTPFPQTDAMQTAIVW